MGRPVEFSERVTAAAAADLVIAHYNPASRERTWQVGVVRDDPRTREEFLRLVRG